MLLELGNVRQYPGEMLRRWFDDDEGFFDLITWINDAGDVSGFQLSYDVGGNERAITWLGGTFSHRDVDPGDDSPLSNESSVLGDAVVHPIAEIIVRFRTSSQKIDPAVRQSILENLDEFAEALRSETGD